jgi:hypothetical protein
MPCRPCRRSGGSCPPAGSSHRNPISAQKQLPALLRGRPERALAARHHPLPPRRRHRGRDPRGHEQPVADLAIDEQLCTVETGRRTGAEGARRGRRRARRRPRRARARSLLRNVDTGAAMRTPASRRAARTCRARPHRPRPGHHHRADGPPARHFAAPTAPRAAPAECSYSPGKGSPGPSAPSLPPGDRSSAPKRLARGPRRRRR